jgi:hypothetical protein
MTNCDPPLRGVNLLERFGDRFRVTWDPAYDPKHVREKDVWMMQLPCAGQGVTIYPHGGNTLAVEVDYRPSICRKLEALGLQLHQDGDGEKTYLFEMSRFDEVAEIVKPRRRRQCHLTPEQLSDASARLAAFRREQRHTAE